MDDVVQEEKAEKECYGRTFTDIASDAFTSDELKDSGLSFDVSQFKANREALYGLQHLQSFAEYPLHMQEKLCKVAWFQEIPPKRIIIRQGHYAENFYFILSGQALVRILEKNSKTGEPQLRTATIMRKGTSFGELALLHHSRRTATVVSQDTIQLLTIGRDDFFDIFMGGNAPGEIPEHIKFCSTLEFMKDWPIEKLLENPQCCLFHFFKRGVVIVQDSNHSDWLYIIKSGSCRVIKQLKGVVPRLEGSAKPKLRKEESNPSLYGLFSEDIVPKVDTGLRRPHTRARTGRTPTPVQIARIEYQQLYSKNDGNISKLVSVAEERSQQSGNQSRPGFSESKFKCYPRVKEAHFRKPKSGQQSPTVRTPNTSKHNTWTLQESLDRVQDDKLLVKEGALKGPVFVQVEVLKPKDVFGLATIRFDEEADTQRTSVSNGAECIMFSKRFFMLHADERVKRMVRHHAYHYPSEPALQENLQRKVDWQLYKRKLIRDIIKNKRSHSIATI
ncbi:hypothetical protein LSH36_14g03078 [Paralvinella palmiformis]|uniref:Cyclic nucleotide-binding domain-containing protein n=1 Tax=Paralvinella palmiformis TaxID=53620 RepID=A0AAD9KCG7_9ANNE|nr:hypothetical protein LSH36_14g03078 [Paralvinella palmiformis]